MPFCPQALLRARLDAGYSQASLAHLTGRSEPDIAAYESGQVTPSLPTVAWLAEALGVSLATLAEPGDGAPSHPSTALTAAQLDHLAALTLAVAQ